MNKIAVITPLFPWKDSLKRTTITHAILDLIAPWSNRDINIIVVRPEPFYQHIRHFRKIRIQSNMIGEIEVVSVPIFKLPRLPITNFRNVTKFLEGIKDQVDILVPHYYTGLGVVTALKKNGWTQPIVYGVHITDTWMLKKKKKYITTPDYIAFRSQSVKKAFISNFNFSQKSYVINSGIKHSIIREKRMDVRNNIMRHKLRFLTVARLIPLKNIDSNLRAFAKLPSNIDWSYTIVGTGVIEFPLKLLAYRLGINAKVEFKGNQSHNECLELMDRHDVFIMVSTPETLGIVYLEAMARGMLVIGARDSGIDGIIINGQNGYIVPPKDVESLVRCIKDLIDKDIDKILKFSEKTIRNLTTEKVSESYLKFIKEALGEASEE